MRAFNASLLATIAARRYQPPPLLAPDDPDHSYDARLIEPQFPGTELLVWPDAGVGGLDLDVASTPAPRYSLNGGFNDEPFVDFPNDATTMYLYGVYPMLVNAASITIAALFRRLVASNNIYITAGTSSTRRHDIYNTTSNRLQYQRGTAVNSVGTQSAGVWSYVVAYFDGAQSTINVNGTVSGPSNTGVHTQMQGIVIGNAFALAQGNTWRGRISSVHYWINRDVRANAEAFCRARLGLP